MRIFISTGEVSGDLQGAILIKALKRQAAIANVPLEITALGGDLMREAGATIIGHTTSIGSVGLLEALPFVIPTFKLQNIAKKHLLNNIPDALVLIDYAAPNIAIGRYVKKHLPQVSIIYYIAPQDWAVPMLGNAAKLTQFVDRLLAVFPQEANYYRQKGIDAIWVGHPLIDRMASTPDKVTSRKLLDLAPEQTVITLLPASRRQEIEQMLPVIGEAASLIQQQIPDVKFLVPLSLNIYREAIIDAIEQYKLSATLLEERTLEAISAADLAITKSGTVNLEIALLDVPQVVLYRVHPLTAWLARNVLKIKVPLMSPPNLIVDEEIIPELQQELATPQNIARTALELLANPVKCQKMIASYQQMRSLLGESGVGDRAAAAILKIKYNIR